MWVIPPQFIRCHKFFFLISFIFKIFFFGGFLFCFANRKTPRTLIQFDPHAFPVSQTERKKPRREEWDPTCNIHFMSAIEDVIFTIIRFPGLHWRLHALTHSHTHTPTHPHTRTHQTVDANGKWSGAKSQLIELDYRHVSACSARRHIPISTARVKWNAPFPVFSACIKMFEWILSKSWILIA